MRAVARLVSESKYRNRIIRDIIITSIMFATLFFLYVELRKPLPIQMVFRSVLQDVKSTLLDEYAKIYYPVYYFSLQMAPVFAEIEDSSHSYKTLVTNFFPKHPFIEEAVIRSDERYFHVQKSDDPDDSGNSYSVSEDYFQNDSVPKFSEMTALLPKGQLTLDSFYMIRGELYIHLVYIANNDVGFAYVAKFDTSALKTNEANIQDVYAYVAAGNSLISFQITETTDASKAFTEDYNGVIDALTKAFNSSDKDMARVMFNNHSYWGYRGTFSVAGNTNEVGIIVPEKVLSKKIQLPLVIFFIVIISVILFVLVIFAMHYLQLLEQIRKEIDPTNIKLIIDGGENALVEFKASMRYDTHTGKVNKALEDVIIKSIAAFNNAGGGRLFIGIKNDGEIAGLEQDYSTLKHPNRDGFELHLRTLVETAYGNVFSAEGIDIDFITEDEKEICVVAIKQGKEPLYTKTVNKQGLHEEKFYIRAGNSSREISYTSEIIAYVKKHFK